MRFCCSSRFYVAASVAMFVVQPIVFGATLTVLTVPVNPANPTTPHTAYPVNATTEKAIVLGATVPSAVGSTDHFTFQWNFGDGTTGTVTALTNPYDISATHQYPASAGTGTQWTATVTVTDTTNGSTGTANYYVIQEPNQLKFRVSVAIDWGLWYMHQTEWRGTTTVGTTTVPWGGWERYTGSPGCPTVGGNAYDCDASYNSGAIDASNLQAFEVNNHYENGPSIDPYTDDVARGLARLFSLLATQAVVAKTYDYNPATANYGCSSGYPTPTNPNCLAPATKILYNPGATSCGSPPCSFTFDGNGNGLAVHAASGSGEPTYEGGQYIEAIVAGSNPNATSRTGPAGVVGTTYQNIVQDMVDYYAYSQYNRDLDVSQGYTRGGNQQGGGWWYSPQTGGDNSASQWAAIGIIAGERGFNVTIPPILKDANQVWITNSQDVQHPAPTGPDPWAANDDYGAFGYNGSLYYSDAWGSFAVTPSGMVQMSMDNVGRTSYTAFGDSGNDPDQRWNNAETYYADNFCNSIAAGGSTAAYNAPRGYTYGLFSFTKAMLLHVQNGNLTPIQYLRTKTPNVFTGDATVPSNTIDWYSALSAANGGSDPCDGVAQTLVGYQAADGHWYGENYDAYQNPFETSWAIIMLTRNIISTCVSDLAGTGAANGSAPARIDLSWSNQANSTSYHVLRGTTNSGPYTQIGTTSNTSYSDTNGLNTGSTYYYVVQPVNGSTGVCQSNQATITVPVIGGRH